MTINHVTLSGNITRDAEVRRTQSGMAIVSFCVASNERKKNSQTGEWENYANFVDCVWFGEFAERQAATMTKGTRVCVDGHLHYSSWERDGQKRSKLEVIAENVELPPRPQSEYQRPTQAQAQAVQSPYEVYDSSEIPF